MRQIQNHGQRACRNHLICRLSEDDRGPLIAEKRLPTSRQLIPILGIGLSPKYVYRVNNARKSVFCASRKIVINSAPL